MNKCNHEDTKPRRRPFGFSFSCLRACWLRSKPMRGLVFSSLRYYWRTNLRRRARRGDGGCRCWPARCWSATRCAAACATWCCSVSAEQIGVVLSTGFFREALAADLQADQEFSGSFTGICPLIVMPGAVSDQETGRRSARVQVCGVDDRFWTFHGVSGARGPGARDALAQPGAGGRTSARRQDTPSSSASSGRPRFPSSRCTARKDNVGRTLRLQRPAASSSPR